MTFAPWIPLVPLIGAILCGLCATRRQLQPLAGWIAVLAVGLSLAMSVEALLAVGRDQTLGATWFTWMAIGNFQADIGWLFDSLTVVMLLVVTGVGFLVTWYAMGYMKGDKGYARFFSFVCLFIFAMTTLVMADNLALVYLGWEGVGLCSYLLIGFYYERPEAVKAGQKAFIVNRIGDLGFALGIFLCFLTFGTIEIEPLVQQASELTPDELTAAHYWIPFLLMAGAFGKSAQIPLHVWLPDAMAGPTPVSALIHAATMVTAGVYLIARLLPVFALSPYALPTVAVIGGLTAVVAATIACAQNDIKKVFAYSTMSQLGYMFMAVGCLSAGAAVFHLFTHAFFKALLFLTAGSVMHAAAGQLDILKLSGLRHKMPVTAALMGLGSLALAGCIPFAGFWSKDMILHGLVESGLGHGAAYATLGAPASLYMFLGVLGLITAGLTAYYTARVWFHVFWGPTEYEMGDEHHGEEEEGHYHHHASADIHEVGWGMNAPLVILAVGAVFGGALLVEWVPNMVWHSTARLALPEGYEPGHHGLLEPERDLRTDRGALVAADGNEVDAAPYEAMSEAVHEAHEHAEPKHGGGSLVWIIGGLSTLLFLIGAGTGFLLHGLNRDLARRGSEAMQPLVVVLANRYYIDAAYTVGVVGFVRGLGVVAYNVIDRLVINGLVYDVFAKLPYLVGMGVQPSYGRGKMQGYALAMAVGLVAVLLLVLYVLGTG